MPRATRGTTGVTGGRHSRHLSSCRVASKSPSRNASSLPSSKSSSSLPSPSCPSLSSMGPTAGGGLNSSAIMNNVSSSPSPCYAPPRALRVLRLMFYLAAVPTFLYAMYVQLIVLKGPGRTPLPASLNFGRDTLFLTFHGNVHCTWYACLCLLHAFISLPGNAGAASNSTANGRKRRRSSAARAAEWATHRFTAVLFPLGAFVGLAYYLILHYHPLNRLRAQAVPDHDFIMALLHLNPLLFVIGDSWLKDTELLAKFGLKQRRATRGIMLYGIAYFLWTAFCVRHNGGHWPYPFQQSFSVIQHVMFVLASCLFSAYLCRAGFRLHGRLDRRRRRRLAVAFYSDRSSTNRHSSVVH